MLFINLKNLFYKVFNKISFKRNPTSTSLVVQKYAFYFFSLVLLTLFYFLFASQMKSNSESKKDSFEKKTVKLNFDKYSTCDTTQNEVRK